MTTVNDTRPSRLRARASWHPWRRSIRTQLIVANIVALALLLCAFGVIVRLTVRATMLSSVDRELDGRIHRFVDAPAGQPPLGTQRWGNGGGGRDRGGPPGGGFGGNPGGGGGPSGDNGDPARRPQQPPRWPREPNPYRARIFYPDGKPFEPQGDAPKIWDADALAQAEKGAVVRSNILDAGVPVRVLTRAFPAHGTPIGVIQAPYALTDVDHAVNWLDRALLFLIPVALLCAGLGGAFLTDRMLRRVRTMATAAGRIGADDLTARLPAAGDDEFSHLAQSFNGLLGRVEAAFQAQERLIEMQRRFTADASHELKTPLTTIKGTASMALYAPASDEMYRQSLVEIDRAAGAMSHLVQDLLLLARADDGRKTEMIGAIGGDAPIELLLGEILRAALPPRVPGAVSVGVAPATAPVTLRLADESLTVIGREDDLTRLFRNLIENAVRATPPDGTVTVTAARDADNPALARITIADTGVGIAPEHLPHLGERFYRVDAARSRPDGGTGLGISISRSIVEAHGGTLAFDSALGVGTTVRVTLPAGAASANDEE